jgi:hypothetical protein
MMRTHPDVTYFVAYHHSFGQLMHYVEILGLLAAAAGLNWHALALPQPAPPSQPLQGP